MDEGNENIKSLNDVGNLNPSIQDIKHATQGMPMQPRYSEEQKRANIDEWNNNPEIKNKGIRAIDSDTETTISKKRWKLIVFATVIGIVSLVIITVAIAAFGMTVWKDGTLLTDPTKLFCGNTTVNVEANDCPIMECPNVVCGDCNMPNNLSIKLTNGTN